MIAIDAMLPDDVDEQREIQRILSEQPDLEVIIAKAQAKAREMFANPRFTLDTRQYDDWDPPIRLIVRADVDAARYSDALRQYLDWLTYDSGYDSTRITISPLFHRVVANSR
jgi:hypothetical protein